MVNALLQNVDKYLFVNGQAGICLLMVSARGRIREWGALSVTWSKEEPAHIAVLWGVWAEPLHQPPSPGQCKLSSQSRRWPGSIRVQRSYWNMQFIPKRHRCSKRRVTSRYNATSWSSPSNPVLIFPPYNKHIAYSAQESGTIHE